MSLSPDPPLPVAGPPASSRGWQSRLLSICFAIFAFEVGLFLVVFPWTDTWNLNFLQSLVPALEDFWDQPSFRGALTGLGFVNMYIATLEVFRLLRRP